MGGHIFGLLHYENDKQVLEFATATSCFKDTFKVDFKKVTVQEVQNLMGGDSVE